MNIASIRLENQQIGKTAFTTPREIVHWLGAVQAQDYAMSKWAIGLRLPGVTDNAIEKAIAAGSILRTHVLRPTWHLVAATDIHWMLELTAPNILRSMGSRHRELNITERSVEKSKRIIAEALTGNRHLTREELIAEMNRHGLAVDGQQAVHYLAYAELGGLICCGAAKGSKQTYALLSERVGAPEPVSREKALEKLARRYFTSHAPATVADFSWWSGLSLTDARNALEMVRHGLVSETVGGNTYWMPEDVKEPDGKPSVYLLPAFDEFLIGYKTREVTIAADLQPRAFTSNGIFRPTIVVNGQTIGIWKRTVKKDAVHIETEFFKKLPVKLQPKVRKAAEAYAAFLGIEEVKLKM